MSTQSPTWPKAIPGWLNATLICGTFATLLWLEHRRPLRRQTERKLTRNMRNLAMVGLSATTIWLTERPVASALAQVVERGQWGLMQYLRLPAWLKVVVSVLLLDYTLYLWHVLTHKVPLLWRFHRVHHADLDLDASTAIRFHFGELIASVPWRAAQIVVIGVDPRTLTFWQTLTLMSVLFHRANVRLSPPLERLLGTVLVTPRMHGIHHSREKSEMGSNWSSGLSVWDRMHGTLRLDVPQEAIEIGVADAGACGDVTLPRMLAAPFTAEAGTLRAESL